MNINFKKINNLNQDYYAGSIKALKNEADGRDKKEKEKIIKKMLVKDVEVSTEDLDRFIGYLSVYPKQFLEHVLKNGTKIYIISDYPQPEGKLKPTDFGFHEIGWILGTPFRLNEFMDGAYSKEKNLLYLFRSLLAEKFKNSGKYTAIHEFAHALDMSLSKDPRYGKVFKERIENFYNACHRKESGHEFNDLYSATNKMEYFAVAVAISTMNKEEAYDETGKFDMSECYRDHLKQKDPDFLKFVDSFLKNPTCPDKWHNCLPEKALAVSI